MGEGKPEHKAVVKRRDPTHYTHFPSFPVVRFPSGNYKSVRYLPMSFLLEERQAAKDMKF